MTTAEPLSARDEGHAVILAAAIECDEVARKPGLTREERRASIVEQLRRANNGFCRRVLDLIGEP